MATSERIVTLRNEKGLHVRAATALQKAACQFRSAVRIEHDGQRSDARSVMQLLLLQAAKGSAVRIEASGDDAEAAVDAIAELIERGFGE
jgi:phosphotransferase system HPr (HPr) family protein